MPTIYLLRHCEYANPRQILPGRLPVELSDKGKNDAEVLKHFFADKNIGHIYSSAVRRCQQTSEIVSAGQIPMSYDQRLLETFSAYQGYWGDNWEGRGFNFYKHRAELGGESMDDLQRRMLGFWTEKVIPSEENLLICSHGDPLMALWCALTKTPLVAEEIPEAELVGWLEKGEFWQVTIHSGQVTDLTENQRIF